MYYVIEIQKTDEATAPYIVQTAEDKDHGESLYHLVLSAAAISTVPWHSAILLDDECQPLKRQTYRHGVDTNETDEPIEDGDDA